MFPLVPQAYLIENTTMLKGIIKFIIGLFLLAIVAALLLTATYQKDIQIPDALHGRHIQVDGVKLRVHQSGSGPDVLFLHSSIGNLEDFETVLPELSKHFRVTTFDRIGHGYSEMINSKANIASNAYYTTKLIQKLDLKHVIIVGHSYGGSIALKMAIDKVPDIRGYVLLAPAPYPLAKTKLIEHILAAPAIGTGLLQMLRPIIAERMLREGMLNSLKPNEAIFSQSYIDSRINLWNNTGILHTRVQQTADVNTELEQMSRHYKTIQQPISVLLGKQEPHRDIANGCMRLVGNISQTKLILLEDTGHYIQYRQPAAVIDAIAAMHATYR